MTAMTVLIEERNEYFERLRLAKQWRLHAELVHGRNRARVVLNGMEQVQHARQIRLSTIRFTAGIPG